MTTIEELSEKLDKFITKVDDDITKLNETLKGVNTSFAERLNNLEGNVQDIVSEQRSPRVQDYRATSSNRPVDPALSATRSRQYSATEDAETQYGYVKDSVSKVTLDKDFEVPSVKRNIKRQDHTAVDIIGKCGGYASTTLKLLAAFDKESDSLDTLVNYVYMITLAQVRYLQTKYGAMSVKGNFDDTTSK